MPKFGPAPEALVRRFGDAVASLDEAQTRKMFGYPAAFLNGNMFAGLFQDSMILRLGRDDRDRLIARGGRPFEPMPGRPMREYLVVPAPIVSDARELREWLGKSAAYARGLPPKKSTARTKAKTRPRGRRA